MEVTVFPDDAEIIGTTQDPALDPASHGLSIESLIIRGSAGHKSATLKFQLDHSLPVSIAFSVSLRVAGQTVACGTLWAARTANGASMGSDTVLSADIPQINDEVKQADVVLTPNPKPIEMQPDVDTIWGKEVVFKNVAIRRLDLAEPKASGLVD
jgi:hypothetical protein